MKKTNSCSCPERSTANLHDNVPLAHAGAPLVTPLLINVISYIEIMLKDAVGNGVYS